MRCLDYIGFDVHKKTINFCAKASDGQILDEDKIAARRVDLNAWAKARSRPWMGAMEATLFTGWIYDYLLPHAAAVKVAHPLMLRAIAAAKKKNDRIDACKIADCLRCNFLPECYMASTEIREQPGNNRGPKTRGGPDEVLAWCLFGVGFWRAPGRLGGNR